MRGHLIWGLCVHDRMIFASQAGRCDLFRRFRACLQGKFWKLCYVHVECILNIFVVCFIHGKRVFQTCFLQYSENMTCQPSKVVSKILIGSRTMHYNGSLKKLVCNLVEDDVTCIIVSPAPTLDTKYFDASIMLMSSLAEVSNHPIKPLSAQYSSIWLALFTRPSLAWSHCVYNKCSGIKHKLSNLESLQLCN